ncbi:hypothetical protein GB927_033455 [Shinella sp. CPCC 100929]|uniref:Uncharacterized protein n=1 Tax=Shinella lacus TaxID=2654216 RepID=A0ABT1RIG7_9HYPH|nr:hypothetical protein [Shinella lacus]
MRFVKVGCHIGEEFVVGDPWIGNQARRSLDLCPDYGEHRRWQSRIKRKGRSCISSLSSSSISRDLSGLANRNNEFRLSFGRGNEFAHGGRPDPLENPQGMYDPDLRIETLKVKAQIFH